MVVGRSRSGTTVLQRTLNTHPKIHLANELHIYEFAYMYPDTYFQELAKKVVKPIHNTYVKFREHGDFINRCV